MIGHSILGKHNCRFVACRASCFPTAGDCGVTHRHTSSVQAVKSAIEQVKLRKVGLTEDSIGVLGMRDCRCECIPFTPQPVSPPTFNLSSANKS